MKWSHSMFGSGPFPRLVSRDIQLCFNICYEKSSATAFLLGNGNRTVLVTAAHCISNAKEGDNMLIRGATGWQPHRINKIKFSEEGFDVCIFAVENFLISENLEQPKNPALFLGHPVIYVGFPHGLVGNYPNQNGIPTGLAKTGFYSGMVEINGLILGLLDGVTNPGFSGGPIYGQTPEGEATVFAVMNGYRYEKPLNGQLFKDEGNGEEAVRGHYVKLNSGFIYTTSIRHVLDLMRDFDGHIQVAPA